MSDQDEIQRKLQKIIAQLESLKETLEGDDLQQASAPLLAQKAALEAQLTGSGAISQGDGAQAVGAGGLLIGGNVENGNRAVAE